MYLRYKLGNDCLRIKRKMKTLFLAATPRALGNTTHVHSIALFEQERGNSADYPWGKFATSTFNLFSLVFPGKLDNLCILYTILPASSLQPKTKALSRSLSPLPAASSYDMQSIDKDEAFFNTGAHDAIEAIS
jgi:hypothetical protein